jgi:hypothetical protein
MNDTEQFAEDLAILEQLNLDYNHSDQASDAMRFSEFLAEDFIVQTPGVTRNREEYLEYIAKPRPFKNLALYTDAYQKREGVWVCVSACAIAPGA